jgi:hypothetical protein
LSAYRLSRLFAAICALSGVSALITPSKRGECAKTIVTATASLSLSCGRYNKADE